MPATPDGHSRVEEGLIGDAREVLGQLVAAVGQSEYAGNIDVAARTRAVQARKARAGFFEDHTLHSDEMPVLPQRLVRVLQDALDTDAVVSLDAGNNRVWMCPLLPDQIAEIVLRTGGTGRHGMGDAGRAGPQTRLARTGRSWESPATAAS